MTATLTGLTVYPLKSGGGTPLTTAGLVSRGLRHDREFMLVDSDGRFLSQRTSPEMALLRPAFDGEALTVAAPGAAEPLVHKATADGPVRAVTVHGKDCSGVDQGDEAALWFGSVLGLDCRLVRFTGHRATSLGGGELMFADGYPLLVISEESLDDLNARLDAPLPMDRFRPNLVLRGLGAYGEDRVRRLRVGGALIEMVKPSARCVITTIDQRTAERGREPLRTLATYRMQDQGLRFGHNAVPRSSGTLTVGDPVEVLDA
ncbi:MOSC domain-containing protein [Actinomadura rayongensis]|uniref:MOSC domain-containing protein n=1 Tax=Actinomadura rayongensis TaxID=1429076 RepID=A0A6I4W6B8_9ACTN|nr:MOSC N-terminal beta barrel domain-containing protein [Actinomadura rayongensis]MXQ65098.1 MOSC domain-containing protein [Actinomadura rayongensis]